MNRMSTLVAAATLIVAGIGFSQEAQAGSYGGYGVSSCGGIAGLVCPDPARQYCDMSGQCNVADALGTCRPRPEVCTADFRPVCGCDGQTYGNACSAAAAGASIASQGECPTTYN